VSKFKIVTGKFKIVLAQFNLQFLKCKHRRSNPKHDLMDLKRDPSSSKQSELNSTQSEFSSRRSTHSSKQSTLNSKQKTRKPKENCMARIRLNLRNLSVPAKIAKGRQIVTAMTDNKNFANPTPPLNDITTAVDGLEQAAAQVQSARAEVSTRAATQDNAEVKLDQLLTQLAGYVESVAGKDDTLITSVGMETKGSPSTPTLPNVPQALSAAAGDHDGELFLSWKPVPNAKSYVIEFSTDPAAANSWTHAGIATSATKTISNLKSGTRYWFRVAAVGAGGQSGWSEQATKVAP
jgi:hypothetical protein